MVAHPFDPRTWEVGQEDLFEFETSLVYMRPSKDKNTKQPSP